MRILLITDMMPYPPTSGTPLRNYHLMRRIGAEHEVWVVSFVETPLDNTDMRMLKTFCASVDAIEKPRDRALAQPVAALRFLSAGIPPDLRQLQSKPMVHRIQTLLARMKFDVIQVENSYMALYLSALPQPLRQHAIVTFIDIVFNKYDRIWRLEAKRTRQLRLWLHSRMMRRWEPHCAAEAGRCLTMSQYDRQLLLSTNPSLRISVIPNGVDTQAYQLLPDADAKPNLLFVGNMVYRPNIDGVRYFCNDILPIVRQHVPEVEVTIVGLNPPPEVRRLSGNGIIVTGEVADLRPYYARSPVCIVPLRAGSGTRLKILEAMALGRPVVSTSIGCEGLDVHDDVHLCVADDAETFARRTVDLLCNRAQRQRLSANARRLVEMTYDWDVIAAQLLDVYAEVSASPVSISGRQYELRAAR